MKIYSFDIDGTICTNTYGDYEKADPFLERILSINNLFKKGNIIKLFTARGSTTGKDWSKLTKDQLAKWGVLYHELIMGKPEADIFVDDKAINDKYWLWETNIKESNENLDSAYNFFNEAAISFSHICQDSILLQKIELLGKNVSETITNGGKIFLAGNGGSFSDAQHLAAEFIGKLNKVRVPLPAIALGNNLSAVTAIANDFGYEDIFSREIEALGTEKDYLITLSTSGKSKNILKLLDIARLKKIKSAILTGPNSPDELSILCDLIINTPKSISSTAAIQQVHIAIGHYMCELGQSTFMRS
tara:strand:+ start:4251 stop:5159 length:909 start_codon:yes stop_codon:yes gene_type:complete